MSYTRVIPRDLFNEAKLLKCLGQLALLLHEGKGIRWPLWLVFADPEKGFVIDQNTASGGLFCTNLTLYLKEMEVCLFSVYNSKSPFPLLFDGGNDGEGDVFNDDGSLSEEFSQWLDGKIGRATDTL
jgi:hypothetical protein